MKFFISGEIDTLIEESWRPVRNSVQQQLNDFCLNRDYGDAVKEIGIVPIVLRAEWRLASKERRLFQRKSAGADYRTYIDFDAFLTGDESMRKKLLVTNILEAVADLQRKAGSAFAGDSLTNDILSLF